MSGIRRTVRDATASTTVSCEGLVVGVGVDLDDLYV